MDASAGWRGFLERYGIALGVVVGLTLVIAVLPGNAGDRTDLRAGLDGSEVGAGSSAFGGTSPGGVASTGTPGAAAGGVADAGQAVAGGDLGGGATPGAPGAAPGAQGGPGVGATPEAPGTGGTAEVVFGEGPCRPDGRQAGVSIYMPPCARWTGTDNGGATARGVTAEEILVIRYLPQLDPGTQAILQSAGLADDSATIKRSYDALRRYGNLHHETYAREVVFVDLAASGPSESDEAMKADALKIANDLKPFAVIEGNPAAPMPTILIRELAQRGVVCLCSTSLSSEFYVETPPLVYSSLPTVNDYAATVAEFVGKRLAGRKAVFAGDELNPTQGFRGTERVFGLIYLEGARGKVDPEGKRARDAMVAEMGRNGVQFAEAVGYIYDPGRNQQDVTNLIATMKNAGVTTIVPLWDPLYPILITKEASNQQYFPEWFVVGTGLSDTTTAGRLYDQLQWRHAFGVSPLWVTWATVARSPGYREYHHARPQDGAGTEGVLVNIYRARIQDLFRGIHMAGPRLTNETYVAGQLGYPKTGGKPAAPLHFFTREDPTEIKDFTEVFWGANVAGPDERGQQGTGMMMKVNGGKRYVPGQWPATDSKAFDLNGAIAVSDDPPGGGEPDHEQDGHRHPAE